MPISRPEHIHQLVPGPHLVRLEPCADAVVLEVGHQVLQRQLLRFLRVPLVLSFSDDGAGSLGRKGLAGCCDVELRGIAWCGRLLGLELAVHRRIVIAHLLLNDAQHLGRHSVFR